LKVRIPLCVNGGIGAVLLSFCVCVCGSPRSKLPGKLHLWFCAGIDTEWVSPQQTDLHPQNVDLSCFFIFLFDLFLQFWDLNSETCTCQAGTVPLEPHPQPFFSLVIFPDRVSHLFCLGSI
jgi:hypothetical protein